MKFQVPDFQFSVNSRRAALVGGSVLATQLSVEPSSGPETEGEGKYMQAYFSSRAVCVKPYYKREFSYFAHNFGKTSAIWLKFEMTHFLYIPLMMIGFSRT